MSFVDVTASSRGGPLAWRRAWLAVDENERAQTIAATRAGGVVLAIAVAGLIFASGTIGLASTGLIAVTLAAVAAVPTQRTAIVVASSVFFVSVRPYRIAGWQDLQNELTAAIGVRPLWLQAVTVLTFLVVAYAFLSWQKRNMHLTAAKRPVLTLIFGWLSLFLGALLVPAGSVLHTPLWIFLGISISCLWFLAYAAVDQKVAAGRPGGMPTFARAGFMRPFWGGSALPIGKSFGYLSKFDAKSEADLGQTRLKALKLAVWAFVLVIAWRVCDHILHDLAEVPYLQTAILAHASGEATGGLEWASVVSNYFLDLMVIAFWGHFIIAAIRMCGWRIPRNTYNPLASRTLAEFWNRYFFYFKELLVDFFFYPAFLRWFKKSPKLRIAFATLCAAGLGNFLYHFMRETHHFATKPVAEALAVFPSAVFYSLALATGLIVSQLRGRKARPEDGFWAYHVWPRLNVMAFFCLLKIFDDISGEGTLLDRFSFTASLFGVTA